MGGSSGKLRPVSIVAWAWRNYDDGWVQISKREPTNIRREAAFWESHDSTSVCPSVFVLLTGRTAIAPGTQPFRVQIPAWEIL